jgi:hypothetical protein
MRSMTSTSFENLSKTFLAGLVLTSTTPALKWPAWSDTNDVFVDFVGDPIRVENFNTQGIEWLAAHQASGRGARGAAGAIAGVGPRDWPAFK